MAIYRKFEVEKVVFGLIFLKFPLSSEITLETTYILQECQRIVKKSSAAASSSREIEESSKKG